MNPSETQSETPVCWACNNRNVVLVSAGTFKCPTCGELTDSTGDNVPRELPTFKSPKLPGDAKERPIPEACYPCKHCRDEYSWPARDLAWSEKEEAWVCNECWDRETHGEPIIGLHAELHAQHQREIAALRGENERLLNAARRFCKERGVDLREVAIAYDTEPPKP